METHPRIAVVTGAGRREGIGFEVCRQLAALGHAVVLTGRSAEAIEPLAASLRGEGLEVTAEVLDVADDASVARFTLALERSHGRVNVLINNAAGTTSFGEAPSTTDLGRAHAAMEVTLFGAWRVTRALLPLLRRASQARVVNVSSGAGSHGDVQFGLATSSAMGPAYAVAKAALNALTSAFARELHGQGILVNAVCPGLTATFPGGAAMGARPVEDGARSVVWAAMLPEDGPSGGFFRDGQPLPW